MEDRVVTFQTGREGAILAEINLIKAFSPERSEEDIRKEVEAKVWEDGLYEIGGDDNFIKYLGLWDKEHADGLFGIRVRNVNYIEQWIGGFRVNYRIVSDEEFETLKQKHNKET